MEKNTLAGRIQQLREDRGWTQTELARKAGIRQSFIGALEAGNQSTSGWLPEIAKALGVDAYWLKTGKGDRGGAPGVAEPEAPHTISPAQQRAMELFSALPDRDQAHLIYLMERMLHPVHADQDSGSPTIKRSDNANLARLRPSNNVINKKIDRS